MKITKQQVLDNLNDVKKYIEEVETKKKEGITIKTLMGNIIFQSTKTTYKEAVEEALEGDTNLISANLI